MIKSIVEKYFNKDVPKEIILNIILVYYGARFTCLLEYTNFSAYYSKKEFYDLIISILTEINNLHGPMLCICLENLEYSRYLIFLSNNFLIVDNIMKSDNDPHWKTGILLEMTKPGGDFNDLTKMRICARIVVEKFPGIDLFSEVFPIINVFYDYQLIHINANFRLKKYNDILNYFGFPCKIEIEIYYPPLS